MNELGFTLLGEDSKSSARIGKFRTGNGEFETPVFMPVGTVGAVKAVGPRELEDDVDAEIILGNTYHLYLRPGLEILNEAGGLHAFSSWNRPMLTDSGGYQVFSLAQSRKLSEEGATFQSHIDGSSHLFTPENVIDAQRKIGADIIMAFDECPPYPSTMEYARDSMALTHRWLNRCIQAMNSTEPLYGYEQFLFPICQGSTYPDLRKTSCEFISNTDLPGMAIGGLSVGEPEEEIYRFTSLCCENMPKDKPRYLMGVGTPANLLECISLGVDMFDCVLPTRNARHGLLFTSEGILNMKNAKWASDFSPLDPNLPGYAEERFSKAYIRHLFSANEMLGLQLASIHNLKFFLWLVRESRQKIKEGSFASWKNEMIPKLRTRL